MLIANIILFGSYSIFWITRFCKNKKSLLIGHAVFLLVRNIAFWFTRNINGIEGGFLSMGRSLLAVVVLQKSLRIRVICMIAYNILMLTIYTISFEGWQTICAGLSLEVNLIGEYLGNVQLLRICGVVGTVAYGMFALLSGEYLAFAFELVNTTTLLISFIVRKNKKKI